MRTGSTAPMYKAISKDEGATWSRPEPFTPNGVKPSLMLLDNGVLVLVSGRPGIQIRFSLDGTGETWTEPIEMMNFMNDDGSYNSKVSCGYPAIQKAGKDSFYIVYSDFTVHNKAGETRKTIWCRKVTVKNKQ